MPVTTVRLDPDVYARVRAHLAAPCPECTRPVLPGAGVEFTPVPAPPGQRPTLALALTEGTCGPCWWNRGAVVTVTATTRIPISTLREWIIGGVR